MWYILEVSAAIAAAVAWVAIVLIVTERLTVGWASGRHDKIVVVILSLEFNGFLWLVCESSRHQTGFHRWILLGLAVAALVTVIYHFSVRSAWVLGISGLGLIAATLYLLASAVAGQIDWSHVDVL